MKFYYINFKNAATSWNIYISPSRPSFSNTKLVIGRILAISAPHSIEKRKGMPLYDSLFLSGIANLANVKSLFLFTDNPHNTMSVQVARAVLPCAFFFLGLFLETEALCCKGAGGKNCDNKFCGDCTRRIQYGTIKWPSYSCCSYGTCNAFCCNCKEKCRKPPAGKTHQCT